MPLVTKYCKCGKAFEVYPYRSHTAKYCSDACRWAYYSKKKSGPSLANSMAKMGSKNPHWNKGLAQVPGYTALHNYVRRRLPPSKTCQMCGGVKKLDLANKTDKYLRDLDDWMWLCRSCHVRSDGRIKNLDLSPTRRKHV